MALFLGAITLGEVALGTLLLAWARRLQEIPVLRLPPAVRYEIARTRPLAVRSAVVLSWAILGAGIVQLATDRSWMAPPSFLWAVLLIGLVLLSLIALTLSIWAGMNWARVLYVLASLGSATSWRWYTDTLSKGDVKAGIIGFQIVATIAIIILLFSGGSNAWFKMRRAARLRQQTRHTTVTYPISIRAPRFESAAGVLGLSRRASVILAVVLVMLLLLLYQLLVAQRPP
jgi:hypothetical protein